MKFYHRIRIKLMLGFAIVALIPALIVGLYSVQVSSDSLLKQELNSQHQVVAGQHQNIISFLSSAQGDVQFLAASAPIQRFLVVRQDDPASEVNEMARAEVEAEFLAFARNRGIYYQVRYLDETGQEIVRVDTDAAGNSKPISQDRLQNKGNRYYFSDAVDLPTGSLFVSPLDLNRERGQVEVPHKPVIRYAVPVAYPDGSKAGVVLTNVDASGFLKRLGDTMLLDGNGYFLSHPDGDKAWGSKRDLGHEANLEQELPNVAAEIRAAEVGSITTAKDAISYMRVTVPGTDDNWVVVFRQPLSKLLESINTFQTTFFAILAGALLIALLLALFLDSRITRPIEQLTASAEKVSMGELSGAVKVSDKGEIGQLADAFERMRVSMVRMMERMRKK